MTVNLDTELLDDFLLEAGELLEGLNEQLVALEQQPDDSELLNAIFRAFHTIKGGAGFLGLDAMVDLCHRAEDVFNLLRKAELTVSPELMDGVLQSLDRLNDMFATLRKGKLPEPVEAELLDVLGAYVGPERAPAADAADRDFDAILAASAPPPAVDDEISDQEFESLLDELHGKGRHGGKPAASEAPAEPAESISDAEFEALLDQLHGPGGAPGQERSVPAPPAPEPPVAAAPPGRPAPGQDSQRPLAETTVRVDTNRLDEIMNLVGELVLVRNRLTSLAASRQESALTQAITNLNVVTADLQNSVMRTRMQPIRKVFGRFPRVVRDLSRSLKKKVALEIRGEETDLDKNLVEALADPLIHLLRNSLDHGIETPEVRRAAGKPETGTVRLEAEQSGDHILVRVRDDGAGIDADRLRRSAVARGMLGQDESERLSEQECFELIFLPGATTKEEITEVSGRGVGMDVVKTRITQLNGSIDIDSRPGEGTTLTIRVPLTLAILPTLMVQLGARKFALPLSVVREIFELDISQTHKVDGQRVMQYRGKAPPLYNLREWLLSPAQASPPGDGDQVVVLQTGNRVFGFLVDQVLGQEEVVIKPLGAMLQGISGLAGATITGDGHIALILDVAGLLEARLGRR